jgi:CheY-like chemotaxis protein
VADTGIGIPEEVLPRLFEAFEQGDASMTRRYGGTGLGLAISKRLVELMGGSMQAARRESGGTIFRFFAPMPAEGEEPAPGAPETPAPLRSDLRVLLVEDNEINRVVALRMIQRLGLRAETACTGAEAVLACAGGVFDVVFMDVQMPVMGGIEAAGRIREAGPRPGPWIVALTANAFEENERACRQAGMNDFLTKPFTIDKLADALRRAAAGLSDFG